MATTYPAQIDTTQSLPTVVDNSTPVQGIVFNRLRDAVIAVEATLGVQPNGLYTNVAGRLTNIENIVGNLANIQLTQDLGGVPSSPLVIGIQGRPVSDAGPSVGEVLLWNGIAWAPTTSALGITFSGDLLGTPLAQTVTGIQNRPISPATPILNDVLTWNGAEWIPEAGGGGGGDFVANNDLSGASNFQTVVGLYNNPLASTAPVNHAVPVWDGAIYDVRPLTADDILPGFNITAFYESGSITAVECGSAVVNPTFAASYSSPASSASITNSDSIDSPLVLSSPYTSGTVTGSFSHSVVDSVVSFTLSAYSGALNRTDAAYIYWEPRSFGGVGSGGATSATVSGVTAVLNAGHGTLGDEGIQYTDIGNAYGPFSPSTQAIYLLLQHTATPHTFKDQGGFSFPMNAPITFSFTNQHGAVISMDLYQSTTTGLATPFTITVET